jgi:hypothetical protein
MGSGNNHRIEEAMKIMNKQSKMMRALWLGWGVVLAGFLQGCVVATADSDEDLDETDVVEPNTGATIALKDNVSPTAKSERPAIRAVPPVMHGAPAHPEHHHKAPASSVVARSAATGTANPDALKIVAGDQQSISSEPPPNPWGWQSNPTK